MKKNILVTFTHGSYYIPFYLKFFLRSEFKKYNNRLLKNFSDFGTSFLAVNIAEDNKVVCSFSRALGDPNRDIEAGDLFMKNDFNGIKIWKSGLPNFIKLFLIYKYYDSYHFEIQKKIKKLEKNNKEIIFLDIHDTGNELLGEEFIQDKKRDYGFPEINIGTGEYKTCSKEFAEKLSKIIFEEFGFKSKIDWPYNGGFVSKNYGLGFKNRQVVQIEFGRYLYMNEKTQEIDFKKIEYIRIKFEKVLDKL